MRPGESAETFRTFAAGNGVDLSRCTPRQGLEQMLAFFRDIKPVGCVKEEDGDMLLFQYGTYDWGEGRWFELDITRQFLDMEHVYEDEIDDEDDEDDEDEDEGGVVDVDGEGDGDEDGDEDGDDDDEDDGQDEGDDEYVQPTMSQLSLTFRFEPTPELEALGDRNRWNEGRSPEPAFVSFVFGSPALALLGDRSADEVEVHHSLV